jgi:hypothetical protein
MMRAPGAEDRARPYGASASAGRTLPGPQGRRGGPEGLL